MRQKAKNIHVHASVSDFFLDPSMEKEIIENFEEYIVYLLENRNWISNISIFATALQDFYFNGNVSLGLKGNITEVSLIGQIKLCC